MEMAVNIAESSKKHGLYFSQDLKLEANTNTMVKKGQQRIYFLCQLRKFRIPRDPLGAFFSTVSIFALSSSCGLNQQLHKARNRGNVQTVRPADLNLYRLYVIALCSSALQCILYMYAYSMYVKAGTPPILEYYLAYFNCRLLLNFSHILFSFQEFSLCVHFLCKLEDRNKSSQYTQGQET